MLEEGRGGFMDTGRYREVMTGLFFHGEVPPEQPSSGGSGGSGASRRPRAPSKSQVDQLRDFTAAIAARNQPAE